jgi:hypothetical protein
VITRQPDPDAAEAKGAEGDFRYLVVPQRVQLSPSRDATDVAPSATGRAASGRPSERRAGRTAGP